MLEGIDGCLFYLHMFGNDGSRLTAALSSPSNDQFGSECSQSWNMIEIPES